MLWITNYNQTIPTWGQSKKNSLGLFDLDLQFLGGTNLTTFSSKLLLSIALEYQSPGDNDNVL